MTEASSNIATSWVAATAMMSVGRAGHLVGRSGRWPSSGAGRHRALPRPLPGIDTEHDLADRKAGNQLQMPVTVLQQDWGAALGFDAAALWRAWATDLQHRTVSYGQFMAEEAPADIATTLHELLAR